MHYVGDDGSEEAEQHDSGAGVHDWVQELPGVGGERQRLLQILQRKRRVTERRSVTVLNCFGGDIIKDSWESGCSTREAE